MLLSNILLTSLRNKKSPNGRFFYSKLIACKIKPEAGAM